MALHCLKGDKDEDATRLCARWLKAADRMRTHLYESGNGFDPLRYNETATVGFLVAAAGRARMLALPEFTEDRETLPEGRVRAGRCDLWLASEDWEIEWLLGVAIVTYRCTLKRVGEAGQGMTRQARYEMDVGRVINAKRRCLRQRLRYSPTAKQLAGPDIGGLGTGSMTASHLSLDEQTLDRTCPQFECRGEPCRPPANDNNPRLPDLAG